MSFRGPAEARFVQRLFQNYYEHTYANPYRPESLEKREFGYTPFERKIMVRHLSFKTFDELRKTLVREAPLHVYRSAALYQYPQAPMEEKGWLAAELIFDIDADHLETSCRRFHDYFVCSGCGSVYSEQAASCKSCGSALAEINMVCNNCLGQAKREMRKLLDFLMEDFGLSASLMTISFSGNRGYHLAVAGEWVMGLDRAARQEVVEYISASHLDVRFYGLSSTLGTGDGPAYGDRGWAGRLARGCRDFLNRLAADDEEARSKASRLLKTKDVVYMAEIAKHWVEKPKWHLLKTSRSSPQLQSLLKIVLEENTSHVDTVVSTDVHRLLRLTDTLNGKTGLSACQVHNLDDFNPLADAVVLSDEPVEVQLLPTPAFELGGLNLGPYKAGERVKVPAFAAAYLMCRGLASLVKH
ncbi:MAG: DNA primase small subunit PriS [Candidatus Caldarchaeum sp.]